MRSLDFVDQPQLRSDLPPFRVGDTARVHVKVREGDKERIQVPRIESRHVDELEAELDRLTAEVGPLENFILPGGSPGAARLHVARTVCRRAERLLVALGREEAIGEHTVRYLNRLSDALFMMARFENRQRGIEDILWDSHA